MPKKGIVHTIIHSFESLNRHISYSILRLFLRNKPHTVPLDGNKIHRVLLFRYDAIGDMAVTTAAIDLLHKKLPSVKVDVLASEYNCHIIRHNNQFNSIFIYNKSFISHLKLLREIRKNKYDAVFCFVLFKTTYAGLLANMLAGRNASKITILFQNRKKLYDVFFNVHIHLERDKCTMAELQARMLCDVFGWEYEKEKLIMDIPLGDENIEHANDFLTTRSILPSSPFIAFNISAGREYREFSVEKNIEIVQHFTIRFPNVPIVIIAMDRDVHKAIAIKQGISDSICEVFNSKDILDVCAIVKSSKMVVSPDTSLVHIASAYKKPTVAFYSQMTTYIYEWMPFNVPYRALVAPDKKEIEYIPTQDCYNAVCSLWSETKK